MYVYITAINIHTNRHSGKELRSGKCLFYMTQWMYNLTSLKLRALKSKCLTAAPDFFLFFVSLVNFFFVLFFSSTSALLCRIFPLLVSCHFCHFGRKISLFWNGFKLERKFRTVIIFILLLLILDFQIGYSVT